jgi:hypothetical protein
MIGTGCSTRPHASARPVADAERTEHRGAVVRLVLVMSDFTDRIKELATRISASKEFL